MKNLKFLNLVDTEVEGKGLLNLIGLRRLNLSRTKITPDALKSLSSLTELKMLVLDSTMVSDDELECLLGFPNLAALHVSGTKLSAASIAALKANYPNCEITSDH